MLFFSCKILEFYVIPERLTCLDCVKSKTLCPCLNHNLRRDSTTISLPERFQYPKCSSSVRSSSAKPFSKRGPPLKRSGWLQIFLKAIKPEKTYTKEKNGLPEYLCKQYKKENGFVLSDSPHEGLNKIH